MRLVRCHGDHFRAQRRWKCIASLSVGILMMLVALLAETQRSVHFDLPQALGWQRGLDNIETRLSSRRSPRRLVYPDDHIIGKWSRNGTLDWNSGEYGHAPVSRKLGIIVHIIGTVYMLLGLNAVCDIYFCGALDEMIQKWKIKPDIAGATFMAAGGSAPELCTSLIGAIITENDVGFGTIVGSAVFNVLAVIGCCGMVAASPIKLSWWPLFRDCTWYICGLAVLATFAKTGLGKIHLWEAIVLFLIYVCYCSMMFFNETLEEKFQGCLSRLRLRFGHRASMPVVQLKVVSRTGTSPDIDRKQNRGEEFPVVGGSTAPLPIEEPPSLLGEVLEGSPKLLGRHLAQILQTDVQKSPSSASMGGQGDVQKSPSGVSAGLQAAHGGQINLLATPDEKQNGYPRLSPRRISVCSEVTISSTQSCFKVSPRVPLHRTMQKASPCKRTSENSCESRHSGSSQGDVGSADVEEEDVTDAEALMMMPEEKIAMIVWVFCLPIYAPLYYLTPKPGPNCFLGTFSIALIWIAGYSFILVYCVEMFGKAILGGGDNVTIIMSFTFLAAGTSIPDLVSSMAVARAGQGDMAVSSSIGSNIFDILVGLPIPWMIKIGIMEMAVGGESDYGVQIKSPYISLYVVLLLSMVALVVICIHINGWHLNRALGAMMGCLYIVFLCIVLPVEIINKGPYI